MHPTIVCGLDQGLTMLASDLKGPASTFVRNTFLLFICHSVCGIFSKDQIKTATQSLCLWDFMVIGCQHCLVSLWICLSCEAHKEWSNWDIGCFFYDIQPTKQVAKMTPKVLLSYWFLGSTSTYLIMIVLTIFIMINMYWAVTC